MINDKKNHPVVLLSILNWNQQEKTIDCVKSVLKFHPSDVIICVSDNGSISFNEKFFLGLSSEIKVFHNKENLGFAEGHLQALEYAFQQDVELFWMLNNDLIVKEDTLYTLLSSYKQKGDGLFGSIGIDQSGKMNTEVIWKLTHRNRKLKCSFSQLSQNELNDHDILQVSNLLGYSLMLPMSIVEKHGFIDNSFFLYFEETDYCLRLLEAGVPSYLVVNSQVIHENQGSTIGNHFLEEIIEYYLYRNLYILFIRHAPVSVIMYNLSMFLLRYLRANLLNSNKFLKLTMYQIRGVLHAFLGIKGKYYAPEDYVEKQQ